LAQPKRCLTDEHMQVLVSIDLSSSAYLREAELRKFDIHIGRTGEEI